MFVCFQRVEFKSLIVLQISALLFLHLLAVYGVLFSFLLNLFTTTTLLDTFIKPLTSHIPYSYQFLKPISEH